MKALALFPLLLLLGCAGKAPESRLGEISGMAPGSWAATEGGRGGIDTQWVDRVGGNRAARLVSEALAGNPDLRAAAERVTAAVQVAETAGAARNPQIGASFDARRSKQVFVGFPFRGGAGDEGGGPGIASSLSNNFGSALNINWEPDVWGFKKAGQEALIAEAQAESQNYRAAQASLAAQVVKAWLAAGEASEQIALAEKALAVRSQTLEAVRDRFQRALAEEGGTAGQVRLAETNFAATEASVIARRGELAQARRQLELLMGRYPAGTISQTPELPAISSPPPAGLPSGLLLRRPDILAAERQLAASGRRIKQGKLAAFPQFNLTASGGTTTDSLRKIASSDFSVWSLAGGLVQPLFTGGQLSSEVKRFEALDRAAVANLQSTVLKAFAEVEQALIAEQFLAARQAAVENALEIAEAGETEAFADYANATGDSLTLFTAQNSRIDLASQLVSLRRLRLANRVDLHLALGGDYRVHGKN